MQDDIKDLILSTLEASLAAQLKVIRQLRLSAKSAADRPPRKGRSQVDMAYDVLLEARAPLHVAEIIHRIQSVFVVPVGRESLVSSLTKKVQRGDRFLRTARNTFSLKEQP